MGPSNMKQYIYAISQDPSGEKANSPGLVKMRRQDAHALRISSSANSYRPFV